MSALLPPEEDGAEPPDDNILAGEFVLGVLSAPQHQAAQQRAVSDAAFTARVSRWEQHLAPWLAEIPPIRVSEDSWERLCQALGWRSSAPVASIWDRLGFWRGIAAVAVLISLALWLTRPPATLTTEQPVTQIAVKPIIELQHQNGTPAWLASVDPAQGRILMVPVPAGADTHGRVPELWIIPAGKAPRSLGAVSVNKAETLSVPSDSRAALFTPGSVLAITLEPAAGIPHAAPSSPVIASGKIAI